ncbi:MAG: hypothetical protein GXP40_00695 [Chloroflexi bacterium]|nr:hypothetical protein [Chloroflexota bacterium]
MNGCRRFPRWFALAAGVCLLTALLARAALAQSPVEVYAIQPSEGRPGQELDVTLRGRGFGEANQVSLTIEDIEVIETWVLSDEEMGAVISIPANASPGPRTVEVTAIFGQNEVFSDTLPGGFRVLEAPAPPGEGGGGEEPYTGETDWLGLLILLLGVGVVLLGGAALAVTLTVRWRRSAVRKKWQSQATEQDLPQTCQEGTYFVRREKPKIKPGRWRVTGLKVTLYEARGGESKSVHAVPSEVAKKLDQAARQRLLHGDSEALRAKVDEIGRELTALVLAWQLLSEAGKDVLLETRLEGGQAEVKFVRYRCVGTPGGWRKHDEWTVKLKAVDHLPRALRGPHASETREAYSAFLNGEVRAYLLQLVEEAGRLF